MRLFESSISAEHGRPAKRGAPGPASTALPSGGVVWGQMLALGALAAGVVLGCGEHGSHGMHDNTDHDHTDSDHQTLAQGLSLSEVPTEDDRATYYQSTEEAFESDVLATAEALGLPVDLVRDSVVFQEAFTGKVERLLSDQKDRIAALWVEPVPAKRGHIVFVGDAPEAAAEFRGDPNVVVESGAVLSMDEQSARVTLFAQALENLGETKIRMFYEQQSQRIQVQYEPMDEGLEKELLRGEVARLITESGASKSDYFPDFDLRETVDPSIVPNQVLGGASMWDGGVRECTSGFTVNANAGRGVVTARHCSGLDTILSGSFHGTAYQGATTSYLTQGDIEWHTTLGNEVGSFFADTNDVRDVESIRPEFTMVGLPACAFGRSLNDRECNHTVTAINATVTAGPPVNQNVGNQVLTSHANTQLGGGDSGGPWFRGTKAFGVHNGTIADNNGNTIGAAFTPIEAVYLMPSNLVLLFNGQ